MGDDEKKLKMGVKNGKFVIEIDTNMDGQPILSIVLDLAEVPDEILGMFNK